MNKWIDKWQIKKKYRDKSSKMSSVDRKKRKKKKKKRKKPSNATKKSNNIKYQSNEPALTVITESLEN